jgi:hypothetical protein
MAKRKQKPSSVRHTRSNQLARQSKPAAAAPDEKTATRIEAIVHPATLNQVHYFHELGLRERTLNLPVMVALVLSLVWRQFGSVSEGLRVLKTEGLLWAKPVQVSQQAISERLRTLPADLFERLFNEVLPQMQARWQGRSRPLPAELKWALQHYQRVWTADGSTLDALLRRVGLHQALAKYPLAGKMMGLLDIVSRLPQQVWYDEDSQANDQRFWSRIVAAVPAETLLLLDAGFTNYPYYAQLITHQVTFITRAKRNIAYQLQAVFQRSAKVHDYLVTVTLEKGETLTLRLVEVSYQGQWYRYLTSELDPQRLPVIYVVALYWQRWRIEDAFKIIKRLLGLAYFWVSSENGITRQLWATWLMYTLLVDLADEVAETLTVPLADISLEMIHRSLYFVTQAVHRGETDDPVAYLAAHTKLFGLIKRQRSPSVLARLNLTISDDP